MGTTIIAQALMASGIHLGATLQQLGFLGFPGGKLGGIGNMIEALVILNKEVAVEVGCPMAPFVAMKAYDKC